MGCSVWFEPIEFFYFSCYLCILIGEIILFFPPKVQFCPFSSPKTTPQVIIVNCFHSAKRANATRNAASGQYRSCEIRRESTLPCGAIPKYILNKYKIVGKTLKIVWSQCRAAVPAHLIPEGVLLDASASHGPVCVPHEPTAAALNGHAKCTICYHHR